MKVLFNQVIIELKLFVRDPISVFWTFVFPAIMMVLIGWFFSGENLQGRLYVYDSDQSKSSGQLIQALKKNNLNLNIKVILSQEAFKKRINDNRGELILSIKKGFEANLKQSKKETLQLYYNMGFGSNSESNLLLLYQILPNIYQDIFSFLNPIRIKKINLGAKGKALRYIDFLCPGIIAMSVMSTCLFGVGIGITSYREKGKLRRLALTPLRKSVFILSYIVFRYVVVLLQAGSLVIVGYFIFEINFAGSVLSLIAVMTVGLFTFVALGYLISSRAKKSETTAAIANLLFFPMLLLGGVYFPLENIPEILKPVVNILPLYHLTESLRQVINYGVPFYQLEQHIYPQVIVSVIAFIITVKIFRWE